MKRLSRRHAMRKQCLIFCLVFLIAPALVYPQAGQTGSITGIVRTPDGDPLAGVVVLLKGPTLIIPEIEAVSNKAGVYNFFALSPGIYELSFIVKGLETVVRRGIAISAGDTLTLDINLTLMAPAEAVVVESASTSPPQTRSTEMETQEIKDSNGLKIEQDIFFASISFILKSLHLFSFSGL